jgi:hypothetical protein
MNIILKTILQNIKNIRIQLFYFRHTKTIVQANYTDACKCESTEQKAAAIIYDVKYSQLLWLVSSQASSGDSQYPQKSTNIMAATQSCDCE